LGDRAVTERALAFEDFADKVDEVFVISQDGIPAIPLTLTEATLLDSAFAPPGLRPPFSLTFVARDPRILPQSLYRMEHRDLGAVTIFIVPAAKDAAGVTYVATFN
jgi:hypothetical protein